MRFSPTALILGLGLCAAAADRASLPPTDDTSLFETQPIDGVPDVPWRDWNFGDQRHGPVGATGAPVGDFDELPRWRTRGLFRFDVAAAIPAGSTISGARVRLAQQSNPQGGGANSQFELRRMMVPWIEGDKRGPIPGGAPADPGEPTWSNRRHPDTPWAAPGGQEGDDYSILVSASAAVAALSSYTFEFAPAGVADLQDMLDDPAGNFGWLLKSNDEVTPRTARRFYFKETLLEANPARRGTPPVLEIDYTPPGGAPAAAPPITVLGRNFQGELVIAFPVIEGVRYGFEVSADLRNQAWAEVNAFVAGPGDLPYATVPNSGEDSFFLRITADN